MCLLLSYFVYFTDRGFHSSPLQIMSSWWVFWFTRGQYLPSIRWTVGGTQPLNSECLKPSIDIVLRTLGKQSTESIVWAKTSKYM